MRIAEIFASWKKLRSRNTTVTSDFRPEVEIRPFRACAMYPAINIWTVDEAMRQIPRSTERISSWRCFVVKCSICYWNVCPSVHLSVCHTRESCLRVQCIKLCFVPYDRTMSPVSWRYILQSQILGFSQISALKTGIPLSRAKIGYIPVICNISETVQNGMKVSIIYYQEVA